MMKQLTISLLLFALVIGPQSVSAHAHHVHKHHTPIYYVCRPLVWTLHGVAWVAGGVAVGILYGAAI